MKKNIEKCKDLFSQITCLCAEGREFIPGPKLIDMIGEIAIKGYDICKDVEDDEVVVTHPITKTKFTI